MHAPGLRSVRALSFLGALAAVALLALPAVDGGPGPAGFGKGQIVRSAVTTPAGTVSFCHDHRVAPLSAYLCLRVQALGNSSSAFAHGVDALEANFTPPALSGIHSLYLDGSLNLSKGWARVHLACNATGAASGRVTIFWSISIFDRNSSSFVSRSNTGSIWESSLVNCPPGGGTASVRSPTLVGPFNSSSFVSMGARSFVFQSTHRYLFVVDLGCTGDATASKSGTVRGAVLCNAARSLGEIVTLTGIGIV